MVLLDSENVDLGTSMHEFDLANACGGMYSDAHLEKKIAVIAFICNHCPYVIKIAEDFSALAKKYKDTVEFVAISSNDPDYREEDSFENMTKFAEKYDFTFPYLFDESQEIAKTYGAVCTPDIFVYKVDSSVDMIEQMKTSEELESNYKLAYHGKFEDLDQALSDLESSDKVSFEQFPSCGCSIKWKE